MDKTCSGCFKSWPLSAFGRVGTGYRARCKACYKRYQDIYRFRPKADFKEYQKETEKLIAESAGEEDKLKIVECRKCGYCSFGKSRANAHALSHERKRA